ncbi:hypothetical protein [Myxococcus sp. RHSTA-1-4]|uniref:hypothetical protein n=1 Tax=Myxococcus sp. RHSTA-1-4 TaxID=2874601 RepID=UPI001CBC9469|nr:hypothetical protein [Myxococcus sp. RHSTA-1-4]MBZ4420759.1 hypothetical protein [Myxococcus sp. RHSTA-1-4]
MFSGRPPLRGNPPGGWGQARWTVSRPLAGRVCQRVQRDLVRVSCCSPGKLCGLGLGTIRGLARHLGQDVVARERRCMHQGAPTCELEVGQLP